MIDRFDEYAELVLIAATGVFVAGCLVTVALIAKGTTTTVEHIARCVSAVLVVSGVLAVCAALGVIVS